MRYRYRNDDELKDSGVEWIGKIPKDWEVSKFKYFFNFGMGETILTENLVEKGIPVYSATEDDVILGYYDKAKLILDEGDIIIPARGNSIGASKFVKHKCTCTQTTIYGKLKSNINSKFVYYFTVGNRKRLFQYDKTAIPQITTNQVKENNITYSTYKEQEKIANFLDEKTSQFDLIIAKKEKLIEILEEAKKSLISEVVTGKVKVVKTNDGYELVKRSNEEMKDSGVEWIGEIPKDWEVKPLYTNFIENKLKNKDNLENNVLSLSYGKIKRRDIESNLGLLPETFSNYQIVNSGDLIFRLTDLQNDKKSLRVGLVKERGIITSAYIGLKIMTGIEPYFYYLFHFYDLKKLYYNLGAGVRQSMTFADLKKIPYIKPHINEQNEIANYLDFIMNKYDNIINKNKLHIEKLKEAKQSLISEAVTGKIEILD